MRLPQALTFFRVLDKLNDCELTRIMMLVVCLCQYVCTNNNNPRPRSQMHAHCNPMRRQRIRATLACGLRRCSRLTGSSAFTRFRAKCITIFMCYKDTLYACVIHCLMCTRLFLYTPHVCLSVHFPFTLSLSLCHAHSATAAASLNRDLMPRTL